VIGAVFATWAVGCTGASIATPGDPDSGTAPRHEDAATEEPLLTDAELEVLRGLTLTGVLAPPPDASNRVADDPRAAAWGQVLFFDPGFSGQLLDSDNGRAGNMEGVIHRSVGQQGQSGRVSCASCHIPEDGFSDTRTVHRQISLAAGWTTRRTPSVLDVGHASLLMWDGRFDSLQRQVLGVIESPLEANSSRLYFAQEIARRHREAYQTIFGDDPAVVLGSDYPQLTGDTTGCQLELTTSTTPDGTCSEGSVHGVPGDGAEYDSLTPAQQRTVTTIALNAGKAIAAYERLLSCGSSRFDAFMQGDPSALSASEQRGAALFVGKANCVSCHSGPFFSDQGFHNVGLVPATVAAAFITRDDPGAEQGLSQVMGDPLNVASELSDGDDGRLPRTAPEGMLGAFRTPMLRCVSERPSFMRTAQLRTLREVVVFFAEGGGAPPDEPPPPNYLGRSELAPLGLTDQEIDDLVAFLEALDGPGPPESLLEAPPTP
jgi:cytochrome c peroxidase